MKMKVFFLIAGLAFCMFSCNNDSTLIDISTDVEVKTDQFYAFATMADDVTNSIGELVFTGDDIISYNISSGDLTLTKSISDKLLNRVIDYPYITIDFYLNDKPLLESIRMLPPVTTLSLCSGVISIFLLANGLDEFNNPAYRFILKDGREFSQKGKDEWDAFIKYIRDSDKYISFGLGEFDGPVREGDTYIFSKNYEKKGDEPYVIFDIENLKEGEYYIYGFLEAGYIIIEERFQEFKIILNGVRSEFSFKPQISGWHWQPLIDENGSIAIVKLREGANNITVIGAVDWMFPPIDGLKLTLKSGG